MKTIIWPLLVVIAAVPAWGARKITVGQLEDLLKSLHGDKKSDAEVATALKQVELTQELTRGTMNSLVGYVPGPLSTEQIYVLEARSADLIPPESDLPSTPAPDTATQKALLARAAVYVNRTYSQLPDLTANKTTLRFQDNVEAVAAGSGLQNGAKEVVTSASFSNPAAYVHYINSTQTEVTSAHGIEKLPEEKERINWGANKMIALQQPDPSLGAVFAQAQAAGQIQWLRWELINGKQTAVYRFLVPRRRSRMDVAVCCFPEVTQAGVANFYTSTTATSIGRGGGGGGGGVAGNYQTNTQWHDYKATVPYHGELFIDPETGIVVRMITQAELKPSEVVHRVDTRIDYEPVKAGDAMFLAPVKTFVDTEVVPNGESGSGAYTTRCTLFVSEYKDYQLAAK